MSISPQRFLVETDWLEANLGNPALRVLDATIAMVRQPEGGWQAASGREGFGKGHIPGAQFVDLMSELKDTDSRYSYMLPTPEAFASGISRYGIGNGSLVLQLLCGDLPGAVHMGDVVLLAQRTDHGCWLALGHQ